MMMLPELTYVCLHSIEKGPVTKAYLKIDITVLVHIECPEDVVTELLRIAGWEEHFVHVNEFGWR